MTPELPELPGCLPDPDRVPPHPAEMRLRRAIVDHIELWEDCPRRACRRAGACRSRVVACFDEQRPLVIEIMTFLLYAGYRDEDGGEIIG